jgi:ABC-type phosphate transport system substrate-binding protein
MEVCKQGEVLVRVTRTLAVASAAALAFAALVTTGPAQADGTTTPADNTIVAMGSDTIQFVADKFQTSYTPTGTNPGFFSFDATGGTPVQTKVDTTPPASPCNIARANGSSAGINQLAKWLGTNNKVPGKTYGYACQDVARASRNLKTGDPNWLTSILFARDLITWSSNSGGNATANLNDAAVNPPAINELKAIFQCNDSALGGTGTPVTWNEVGGTSADEITPVLPQTGSGTRSQWLTDLGLSDTTIGSCVVNGTFGGSAVEENEGTNAVFTSTGNPQHTLADGKTTGFKDIVFPYSGGAYLCESLTTNCATQGVGSLTLRQINSKNPTTGTGSATVLNTSGFPATYVRGLYFVARNGCAAPAAPCIATPTTTGSQWPIDMTAFLGNGNNTGYICSTAAQTIVQNFKFVSPSSTQCGALFNSTPTPSPAPPTP